MIYLSLASLFGFDIVFSAKAIHRIECHDTKERTQRCHAVQVSVHYITLRSSVPCSVNCPLLDEIIKVTVHSLGRIYNRLVF